MRTQNYTSIDTTVTICDVLLILSNLIDQETSRRLNALLETSC